MYHVDITNAGDYSFKVKAREYEFLADMEGKNGITPPGIWGRSPRCQA